MNWSLVKQSALNFTICVLAILMAHRFYGYNSHKCSLKFRYIRHCNIDNFPKGTEGSVRNAKNKNGLRMVYTVIRHGDRTYGKAGDQFDAPLDQILPALNISCSADSFISAAIVHRRMGELERWLLDFDRIRISNSTNITNSNVTTLPYRFSSVCGLKSLTPRGFVQMFYLGEFFDNQYKPHTPFGTYAVHLRTTNTYRTRLSGLAFVAGLVNRTLDQLLTSPSKISPNIEMKIVDEETGLLISHPTSGNSFTCKKLLRDMTTFQDDFITSKDFTDLYQQITMHPRLNRILGSDSLQQSKMPRNAHMLSKLTDRIFVAYCHHRAATSDTLNRILSHKVQTNLIRLADMVKQQFHHHLDPVVESRMVMLNFLQSVDSIQAVDGTNRDLPIFIDSTHDSTVMPLIMTLKLPKSYHQWPYFASRVTFELFDSDLASLGPLLRILYNGTEITCDSGLCAESCRQYKRCLFRDFERAYLGGKTRDELITDFLTNHC